MANDILLETSRVILLQLFPLPHFSHLKTICSISSHPYIKQILPLMGNFLDPRLCQAYHIKMYKILQYLVASVLSIKGVQSFPVLYHRIQLWRYQHNLIIHENIQFIAENIINTKKFSINNFFFCNSIYIKKCIFSYSLYTL